MEHTPGPWTQKRERKIGAPIVYGNDHEIAQVRYWLGSEDVCEVEANARLIAAAPDLLAALESLCKKLITLEVLWVTLDIHPKMDASERAKVDLVMDEVRTAIAKAVDIPK